MSIFSDVLQERIAQETGTPAPDLSDPEAFQKWLEAVKTTKPDLFSEVAFELDTVLGSVTPCKSG